MSKEIDALLIERDGYARRGMKDRVKQIDEVLSALGYKQNAPKQETATVEPEAERAVVPRASKRKG